MTGTRIGLGEMWCSCPCCSGSCSPEYRARCSTTPERWRAPPPRKAPGPPLPRRHPERRHAAATGFLHNAAGDALTGVSVTGNPDGERRDHHRPGNQPDGRPRLDLTVEQSAPPRRKDHAIMPRVQEFLVRIRLSDVTRLAKPQPPDCERGSAHRRSGDRCAGVPVAAGAADRGGRVVIAHQVVQSAASDAARAASIARSQAAARTDATTAAQQSLATSNSTASPRPSPSTPPGSHPRSGRLLRSGQPWPVTST